MDESIGSVASQEKGNPVYQIAVAEQKQEYHYNDEAFEDYMGNTGVNERKTMVASSKVPEKKPEKR